MTFLKSGKGLVRGSTKFQTCWGTFAWDLGADDVINITENLINYFLPLPRLAGGAVSSEKAPLADC